MIPVWTGLAIAVLLLIAVAASARPLAPVAVGEVLIAVPHPMSRTDGEP